MKVLDNLRETLGYGGVKLPPLQEVKPQHRLGKFGDYENLHKCFRKSYAGAAGNHLPPLQPKNQEL